MQALAEAPQSGNTRRCLVSQECLPRERMVRFVVGPDNGIVPDIAGRLPGRGLWVQSRRDIVERAIASNAFARAARRQVTVPDTLADQVEALLASRCTDLIGLARRSGKALSGFDTVRRALQRGWAALLVVASDGSLKERARLPLSGLGGSGMGERIVDVLNSTELGIVFGRSQVMYAALGPCRLEGQFRAEAERLAGFRTAQKS